MNLYILTFRGVPMGVMHSGSELLRWSEQERLGTLSADDIAAGRGTARPDHAHPTGPALEAHYRFVTWLVPAVERFSRSQKLLLGDRMQTTALDVLERLIEATYTKRRGHHLARANLGLENLRFLGSVGARLALPGPPPVRTRRPQPGRDRAQGRRVEQGASCPGKLAIFRFRSCWQD